MNAFFILKSNRSFLVFIFLHQIAIVVSNPPYSATDLILLNCGSTHDNSVASDGRSWNADLPSKFGPVDESDNKSRGTEALEQGSSAPVVPYMTARISRSQFTYSFPVTNGPKFIRLYFRSSKYKGGFEKYKDWFEVRAGPYTLLRNFSVSVHAYAYYPVEQAFFIEFCVNVEEEQRLNITFAPFPNNSNDSYVFINGIEIVSMPSYLYYTPPDDQGIKFIGQNRKFKVQNDTALEMVCRLNVGGSSISPTNDTGMYRSWDDDSNYITSQSFTVDISNQASLNYSRIKQYIAPDDVYRSARWMGAGREDRTDNLTWRVEVHPGYTYLVRLHFCEVSPAVTSANVRRFSIFIDNQTAETGLDIFEASGGRFIPIYKDYTVKAGNKDKLLFITLLPNSSTAMADGLLNGLEVLKLNDSTGNLAKNKEPTPPPEPSVPPNPPLPPDNKSTSKKTLLIEVGGTVAGFLIILSACGVLVWRLKKIKQYARYFQVIARCGRLNSQKGQSSRSKPSLLHQELCRQFSLGEINAATNNFDQRLIIGEGGFGYVYKGDIDKGTTTVAIKRLNKKSKQGAREFKTEIEMLSQLRHKHLVSLIGYCNEGGEMILVYGYMVNGTLREHLYDTNTDPLPWKQRLEICVGAARGLDYLHTGAAENTIIHRDIKTSNILLDKNWVAKVADFGLSKIGVDNTAISTMVKGTWGYLDPEYARLNHLTEKSDVYSFGVVLFEVLCGRKPLNQKLEYEKMNLANWARKCIKNGTIRQIIDPYLMGKISPNCFNKFVDIAESCIRDKGIDRPSMHDVKEQLEFALELQRAADADQKGIYPSDEFVNPEVSFCAPRSKFNSSKASSSGFTGLESDTIPFSHTTNSSTPKIFGMKSKNY